jgi:hypothetical protein
MTKYIKDVDGIYRSRDWEIVKPLRGFSRDFLTEDLARYTSGSVTIDFGFYGDEIESEKGSYTIYVIFENDWDEPIARFSSRNLEFVLQVLIFLSAVDPEALKGKP